MKPHQLQLEAFGPYAEASAIDFDSLSEEGLFLIHGSTGAGKTFLLDALCFALYGEVSGPRSLRSLRSDHAPAGAVPRVSLEFSCSAGRYRVERSPAYTAPKSRGQGFTEKTPTAALFRLNGSEAEPIAARISDVNREVESLVGLSADQFRQVILLPQGQFAEVLRARAEEREALLKTLFDSVLFERAGRWLEDQARTARQALADQERELEGIARQALQVWRPFAPADDHPPAEPELLAQRIAVVVDAAAAERQRCNAGFEQAQRARADTDRLADRWDRRAAAAATLNELEAKQSVVDDYRQRLQRAEQAEALRASLEAETAARQEQSQLEASLQQQLRRAARHREAAQALPPPLQQLKLTTLPGLEPLSEARNALTQRRAELSALVRQAQDAEDARRAAGQAEVEANTAATTLRSAGDALAARQQRREATAAALVAATTARDQLDGLHRAAREAEVRARAAEAVIAARAEQHHASTARNAADAALNRETAELLELRQRQLAGMAAQLAGALSADGPCPVCGSTHHPRLAQPSDDAVSEAAITAAEQRQSAAGAAAREAAAALATCDASLRSLLEKAGEAAEDPASARRAAQQAGAALNAAQAQAAELDTLQRELQAHDRELATLQATIQTAGTEQALRSQAAAEARARAASLQAAIAADLGEGLEPQAVLQSLTPLEASLRELAASAETWAASEARLQQASKRLAHDLRGSGFADGEALQAALKEESWRLDLQTRISRYDRSLIEARSQLASPDLHDLPEQRPDTAAAQAALEAADAARTAALEQHSRASGAAAELTRLAQAHRQATTALTDARAQAQQLSAMADRCTGRSAPYISLQRWVLSAYLDEICRYANQRLDLMTSGRYQLRLSDEGGRGGRQAGLGLRVLDAYTGEEREVSSLSGGETFQASLALALGVADTVQAHAGGVQLDALFIDEGFGTLDPDNLQLAMDELDRLREGGRMIGVISHVGALKERIRAGIAISSGENGSRATVCRVRAGE